MMGTGRRLPLGIALLERSGASKRVRQKLYQSIVFLLMFFGYAGYILSRRPISVVKVLLCPVCANYNTTSLGANLTAAPGDDELGWAPFNGDNGRTLLGSVDYAWLFTYSIGLYISGWIADRVDIRYFLSIGMIGSGFSAILMGLAYFANIHSLSYFIIMQIIGGLMQSTGWPAMIAVITNWFGKSNRGLMFGFYSVNYSLGSVLGIVIPSLWAADVSSPWGWSFIVPGLVNIAIAMAIYLLLVIDPSDVGLPPPIQHFEERTSSTTSEFQDQETDDSYPLMDMAEPGSISNSHDQDIDGGEDRTISKEDDFSVKDAEASEVTVSVKRSGEKSKAVSLLRALLIPGVAEYSLALFFNKLVSYTFMFWLPFYVKATHANLSAIQSDWLAILFDVGSLLAIIVAGVISDRIRSRAVVCVSMLLLAVPALFFLRAFGGVHLVLYGVLLFISGGLIVAPYCVITTSVSSDLGTHSSLKETESAKAMVAAIVNGTGSMGAAFGPLFVGMITGEMGWSSAFYFLMACCFISALLLTRLVVADGRKLCRHCAQHGRSCCCCHKRGAAVRYSALGAGENQEIS